ncbi:MAG: hypothetical protein QM767_30595 [Anaeromyxobacter sp.]
MTATPSKSTHTRALAVALAVLATACGSGGTSGSHPSLSGQLRASEGGAAQGPLRLALAWYPGLLAAEGEPISQPGHIATQDLAYEGALPQAYTFSLQGAPPASVLQAMPEGYTGEGAVGVLLAYRDGNDNGALDTIPADGSPVDHVVGASLDWAAAPAYLVAYLTEDQDPASGLEAGFNLIEISDAEDAAVVPFGTAVPLTIGEGGPLLDLFVCEAAWDGSSAEVPCGLVPEEPALQAQPRR